MKKIVAIEDKLTNCHHWIKDVQERGVTVSKVLIYRQSSDPDEESVDQQVNSYCIRERISFPIKTEHIMQVSKDSILRTIIGLLEDEDYIFISDYLLENDQSNTELKNPLLDYLKDLKEKKLTEFERIENRFFFYSTAGHEEGTWEVEETVPGNYIEIIPRMKLDFSRNIKIVRHFPEFNIQTYNSRVEMI